MGVIKVTLLITNELGLYIMLSINLISVNGGYAHLHIIYEVGKGQEAVLKSMSSIFWKIKIFIDFKDCILSHRTYIIEYKIKYNNHHCLILHFRL